MMMTRMMCGGLQPVTVSVLIAVATLCSIGSTSHAFQSQPATTRSRLSSSALAVSSPPSATTDIVDVQMNRGDARGAALLLEEVTVFRGSDPIIKSVDWRVEPKNKWALVGTNGCGKSTLLKALVGEILHDGKITIGTKEKVGYLKQTAVAGSSKTIYEEAASGMAAINKAKEDIERASEIVDLEALEEAQSRFEAEGGYKQEQKVASILKGLGFTDFEKRCDELSGGWQMRVAFARLLLSEPSLCLMDEPGNHLDAAAKKWLARYLKNYDGDGAMILVTHDIELLKSMNHIAEIIPGAGSLQIYKSCNYQQFLDLKEARATAAVAEFEKNSEKAAKLQGFVDRFGASATKASAAQSRVKALDKMKEQGLLDAPAADIVAQRFKPTLVLPNPPKAMGDILLSLTDAQIGYEGKILVDNVNLEITRGMKLLIRGPNGAGKSTALHSLRGSLPLLQGQRIENSGLKLGVFTQDLAQELDPKARAVDLVTAYAREGSDGDITMPEKVARSAMGGLGLQGEKALRRICDLSGGEKARVALAMFALKPSNVFLLDEVSNHLDTECVQALSESLSTWGEETGAVVVISHDKTFCDKITFSHVATVRDGVMKVEQRNVRNSDWVVDGMSEEAVELGEIDGEASGTSTAASTTAVTAPPAPKKEIDPKLRKQAFNAPKRITKLESLVEKAEEQMAQLDTEMLEAGDKVARVTALNIEKEKLSAKVTAYMDEWEELEDLLAQIA